MKLYTVRSIEDGEYFYPQSPSNPQRVTTLSKAPLFEDVPTCVEFLEHVNKVFPESQIVSLEIEFNLVHNSEIKCQIALTKLTDEEIELLGLSR